MMGYERSEELEASEASVLIGRSLFEWELMGQELLRILFFLEGPRRTPPSFDKVFVPNFHGKVVIYFSYFTRCCINHAFSAVKLTVLSSVPYRR